MPRPSEAVRVGRIALIGQDAVLLLAATPTGAERIALLRAGAGHVLNTDDASEVIACLSSVHCCGHSEQRGLRERDILRVGDLCLDLHTRTAAAAGRCLTLTALELDLLACFMSKVGQALTRERLLAEVWGYDVGSLDTVTVHMRRLRMEIEQDPHGRCCCGPSGEPATSWRQGSNRRPRERQRRTERARRYLVEVVHADLRCLEPAEGGLES